MFHVLEIDVFLVQRNYLFRLRLLNIYDTCHVIIISTIYNSHALFIGGVIVYVRRCRQDKQQCRTFTAILRNCYLCYTS